MSTSEFQQLIVLEKQMLKGFALKLTMNNEDANDLLQDTMLKALKYKDKFIESTNLKAWLYVIMKNTFINNYRRKSKSRQFMTVVEDVRTVKHADALENYDVDQHINYEAICKVINELKDEYKVPFLRYTDGFKYQEIADEMNIPIGTVKSRIFLARQELMKKINALEN